MTGYYSPPLGSVRIITSVYLTETKTPIIKRHYRKGERMGRNSKNLIRVYRLPSVMVPSPNALFMKERGVIVIHPVYYEKAVSMINVLNGVKK